MGYLRMMARIRHTEIVVGLVLGGALLASPMPLTAAEPQGNAPPRVVPGVKAECFNPKDANKSYGTVLTPGIDLNWSPNQKYAGSRDLPETLRWTTTVTIAKPGVYRFRLRGISVWANPGLQLDGKTCALSATEKTPSSRTMEGAADLSVGLHLLSLSINTLSRSGACEWAEPEGPWRSMVSGPFSVEAWPEMTARAEDPLEQAKAEFKQARFGVFIHFGPSSAGLGIGHKKYPSHEAWLAQMERDLTEFAIKDFDAKQWADMFQSCDAGYVIFTAIHVYDQFAMWDTATTKYKITNTPFKRDTLKELAEACQAKSLPLHLYAGPNYGGWSQYSTAEIDAMVQELATHYGKLAGLWCDNGLPLSKERLAWLVDQQPHLLFARGGRTDFASAEFGMYPFSRGLWERCSHFKSDNWFWKVPFAKGSLPVAGGIILLAQSAGNGGNLAMNLPPNPQGGYDPGIQEWCTQMGQWMRAHGETIRGTDGGPYYRQVYVDGKPARGEKQNDTNVVMPWGASTCKGNTVFLHLLAQQPQGVFNQYEIYAPPQ